MRQFPIKGRITVFKLLAVSKVIHLVHVKHFTAQQLDISIQIQKKHLSGREKLKKKKKTIR